MAKGGRRGKRMGGARPWPGQGGVGRSERDGAPCGAVRVLWGARNNVNHLSRAAPGWRGAPGNGGSRPYKQSLSTYLEGHPDWREARGVFTLACQRP